MTVITIIAVVILVAVVTLWPLPLQCLCAVVEYYYVDGLMQMALCGLFRGVALHECIV